jgi:ABC-type branched-subunit amino acid transport system permease subunit
VSLGQAAFAGLGALGYAALVNGTDVGIGVGDRSIDVALAPISPVPALVLVTVACAAVAALIGAGAVRVRGLLLAIVTFVFALASQQFIYQRPFFSDGGSGAVLVERPLFGSLDLASQRTYYYVSLAFLALAMIVVARLRRSAVVCSAVCWPRSP